MKNLFYVGCILFISVLSNGCSKSNTSPTTSLQITTQDALGNTLSGTTVTLYSSQTDWQAAANPVATGTTDATGIVKFDHLSPIKYFWSAVMQCKNNVNGSNTTNNAILANTENKITTILSGTGTLSFVNNSSNPYSVYVNGALFGTVPGNSASQLTYAPLGAYTIRVLQNSGYLIAPTDETANVNLTCGQTLTITFP